LGPGTAAFLLLLLIGVLAIGLLTKKTTFSGSPRSDFAASLTKLFDGKTPTLRLQALCGVVGSVVFYHHPYDNIMLYPALLDIFGLALRDHRIWLKLLATAMAIALWAPLHWVANNPTFQSFSTIVSVLVGLTLLAQTSGSTTKSPMEA
ncbi:MAG: hypothetical protein ACK5W5_08560, partial [Cyanobacteriota bacterium]